PGARGQGAGQEGGGPGLQAGAGHAAGVSVVGARRPPAAKRPAGMFLETAQPECGEGYVADGPAEFSYKTANGYAPSKDLFLGSLVGGPLGHAARASAEPHALRQQDDRDDRRRR